MDMINSVKRYINIDSQKICIQVLGEGPAIALLHPSPHTSDMLLPLAEELAAAYTVICVDTPGYGGSDSFPEQPKDIKPYATALFDLCTKMHIEKLAVYGSATGAQIGIRFALEYPKMLSHLYLDNAAHFGDDLRAKIMEHYFPDLTPVHNGSHLDSIWDIVSNLFQYFPWCFKTPEFALNRPQLPAVVLHAIALDFLKAGKGYEVAYRVAFLHEKATFVQKLEVPTTIFRWEGSIILPYVEALVTHDLPSNVAIESLDKDPNTRTTKMVAYINANARNAEIYNFSEKIGEEAIEEDKPVFKDSPPEIIADGTHLKEAWRQLIFQNGEMSALEIQQRLIHWYTV